MTAFGGRRPRSHPLTAIVLCIVLMLPVMHLEFADAAYLRPGVTKMVSLSADGEPATALLPDLEIGGAAISRTGRYVAFSTLAPNLVTPDANPGMDTYVRDLRTGAVDLVSIASDGRQRPSSPVDDRGFYTASASPALSADGRFVAFQSSAPLVPRDTNTCKTGHQARAEGACSDIFVFDRRMRRIQRISVSSTGRQANNASFLPSMSNDGRYVAFMSYASNLISGDTNTCDNPTTDGDVGACPDVFVHDRRTRRTALVSASSTGRQSDRGSYCPAIDATGRHVGFISDGANLVPNDTNRSIQGSGGTDAFVRDLGRKIARGKTERVSVGSTGAENPGGGAVCATVGGIDLSAGGRVVAFESPARFAPNDDGTIGRRDIYVRDRKTKRTVRASVTSQGEGQLDGQAEQPSISDDGRHVAFVSLARNFFPNDGEASGFQPFIFGDRDVFVYDLRTSALELVSIDRFGEAGRCPPDALVGDAGHSDFPALAGGGRYIAFRTCNDDMVADDSRILPGGSTNPLQTWQIYVRDQGLTLGAGGFDDPKPNEKDDEPDEICIPAVICIPPLGVVKRGDDVDHAVQGGPGADLIEARLAFRPHKKDLLVTMDVTRIPTLYRTVFDPAVHAQQAILYTFRFRSGGTWYEARAHNVVNDSIALDSSAIGLFRCSTPSVQLDRCARYAELKGGYGTTGESIVISLPLDALDLERGGTLDHVRALTSFGTFESGPTKVLDSIDLSS